MKVKSKYACKFMFVLIFNRRFDRLKKFKLNKITLSSNLRRKIYYAYGHFWCFFLVWFFFVVFSCGVFMWVFFFGNLNPTYFLCAERQTLYSITEYLYVSNRLTRHLNIQRMIIFINYQMV